MLKFVFITELFLLCEWGHWLLGKLHRCSEITYRAWDAPDYPNFLTTCPLTVIRPRKLIIGPTFYDTIPKPRQNLRRVVFHCWN
jgi:hypothetical protein